MFKRYGTCQVSEMMIRDKIVWVVAVVVGWLVGFGGKDH